MIRKGFINGCIIISHMASPPEQAMKAKPRSLPRSQGRRRLSLEPKGYAMSERLRKALSVCFFFAQMSINFRFLKSPTFVGTQQKLIESGTTRKEVGSGGGAGHSSCSA